MKGDHLLSSNMGLLDNDVHLDGDGGSCGPAQLKCVGVWETSLLDEVVMVIPSQQKLGWKLIVFLFVSVWQILRDNLKLAKLSTVEFIIIIHFP